MNNLFFFKKPKIYFLSCLISILLSTSLLSQSTPYVSIQSQNEIPSDFLLDLNKRAESYYKDISTKGDNKIEKAIIQNFIQKNAYFQEKNILFGDILYGDTLTNYVNSIAQKIIKHIPEIGKDEIKLYVSKNTSVNASSFFYGEIHINLGLLAQLNNEAELAFIIAHELAHYTAQHIQNAFLSQLKNASQSFDKKVNNYFNFSKKHEFEADSIGYSYFTKAGYTPEFALGSLEALFNSDQSYMQQRVNLEEVFDDSYYLPSAYIYHEYAKINKNKNYADKFHTHPNIKKRMDKISLMISANDGLSNDSEKLIISQERFTGIQQIARNEQLRQIMINKQYSSGLYTAINLSKIYPSYIDYYNDIIIKSLYALSKYKSANRLQEVMAGYHNTGGEQQFLNYFIKQLTKKQLNSIVIKYIYNVSKKHPDNTTYKYYYKDLIKDLKNKNNVLENDIKLLNPSQSFMDSLSLDVSLLSKRELSKMQIHLSSFYQYIFTKELKEIVFNTADKPLEDKKKVKKTNIINYSVVYYKFNDIELSNYKEQEIRSLISGMEGNYSLYFSNEIIDIKNIQKLTTKSYNQLSRVSEWMQEIRTHDGLIVPLMNSTPLKLKNNCNNIFQFVNIYYTNKRTYITQSYISLDENSNISTFKSDKRTKELSLKYINTVLNQNINTLINN